METLNQLILSNMGLVYLTICIGAIAGLVNMFLQYYDIIHCRFNDCGNKNSIEDDINHQQQIQSEFPKLDKDK